MSEFVPTHESIGGVKVQVTKHPVPDVQAYDIKMPGTGTCGFVLNGCEFAALFAPLPKPAIVKIPLALAKELMALNAVRGDLYEALDKAVHAEA